MVRVFIVLLIVALLIAGTPGRAVAKDPVPTCIAESRAVTIAATVIPKVHFLEVPLEITNKSSSAVKIEPAGFTLGAGTQERMKPLTAGEAKGALGGYAGHGVAALAGPVGVALSVAAQVSSYRTIDGSILRPGEVAAGAKTRGTLYFRPLAGRVATVQVFMDNLVTVPGERLPALRLTCGVPKVSEDGSIIGSAPMIRTYAAAAAVPAGPLAISVMFIEFANDATTVDLTINNPTETEADVFSALANATLTDQSGKTVAVRLIKSDFPERVPPRTTASAKVAFEPLPSQTQSLTVAIPGIRVGGQSFEARTSIQF